MTYKYAPAQSRSNRCDELSVCGSGLNCFLSTHKPPAYSFSLFLSLQQPSLNHVLLSALLAQNHATMNALSHRLDPRWLTATLSLFISLAVAYGASLTNTDGVLYLRAAGAYMQLGFSAAQGLFDNPYYSVLIGAGAELTGLTPLYAAHLLNALTCAAIGWLIVDLGLLIGGSTMAGLCSGALFLLHPQFNEYRNYIIRDFAFWACLLGFIDLQLRYYLTLNAKNLIAALLLLLVGGLFRIESLLLMVLPLLALYPLRKHMSIVRQTLLIYSALVVVATIIIGLITSGYFLEAKSITLPAIRFLSLGGEFQQTLTGHADYFKGYLLHGYLEEYAMPAVVAGFITIVSLKALKSFTLPYFMMALLIGSHSSGFRLSNVRTAGVYSFFVYYAFILIGFTLTTSIIQGRHVLPLTLVVLPVLGCYLENWLGLLQTCEKKRKRQKLLAAIFTAYLFIDSFISFGSPKTHLPDSINWLKTNAAHCSLMTNDTKIAYFSGLEVNWPAITHTAYHRNTNSILSANSQLVAIEYHSRDQQWLIQRSELSKKLITIAEFKSKKRGVIIFSRPNTSHCLTTTDAR